MNDAKGQDMFELTMRGGVAEVTLCRAPVNAISEAWGAAFGQLLDELEARDDWSVLQLRSNQKVFAAGADDVMPRLLSRTDAVAALLGTENGANLLTAYRRAANILRIESRKDGPHDGPPDQDLAGTNEERILFSSITDADGGITTCLREDDFGTALGLLADLRTPLDAFFEKVTVNAPEAPLRLNRLRLLHKVRSTMDRIADFSKIEG